MDTKDKDESKIRQREAALARRLGEALDQLNPQSAKDCPDAEVIAAYAEHALGSDESVRCENHFAACGRCRNILRVLAAASDAPLDEAEVARLGQRVSAVRAPVEITAGAAKRPRSKAADWSTRWLAPALGIAAVLTVWFVMRPPWRSMDRGSSSTLIAQAPQQELPESAPPIAEEHEQKTAPAPEASPAKNTLPNSKSEPSANEILKSNDAIRENSSNQGHAKSFSNEKKEVAPLESENKTETLAMPPPPPPTPPQSAVSSAMNSSAPIPQARAQADSSSTGSEAPRSTSQSVTVTEAAPQVETANGTLAGPVQQQPAAGLPLNGRNFQALAKLRSAQPALVLLKSVSGTTLWRIGAAGVIEHTNDAGQTWVPQVSSSKQDWLAGAAISDTLCWIAGRNGAIARTTDGENWQSIMPPSQSVANNGKLPDWTAITARDAESAAVTANDGKKFVTTDGGKTWRQQ